MESVVLKTLSDVYGFDVGGVVEGTDVEDEFVGAAAGGVGIEDWVVGF